MRKKVGELYEDTYPQNTIIHQSRGRMDFSVAHDDATTLLKIHDQVRVRKSDRRKTQLTQLEVLKRSALILAVTAWESFVEETVTEQLDKLLTNSSDPTAIRSIFEQAQKDQRDNKKSKPPDLILWTAGNWKNLVRQSLLKFLESFHTPSSAKTAKLFKRYLGVDIVKKWAWKGVSPDEAQKQLDALIKHRGRIVHKGRTTRIYFPQSKDIPRENVQRRSVVNALNLVYNLVDATERALGIAPTVEPVEKLSGALNDLRVGDILFVRTGNNPVDQQ